MSDDEDKPGIVVTSAAKLRTRRPVDEVTEARFLDVLRKTGSFASAAAAVRPHLASKRSAYSVMRNHVLAKPTFAAKVKDVLAEALGEFEAEVQRRAMEGVVTRREYGEDGKVKAETIKHDNKLLVQATRRLERMLDPDADGWASERRQLPPPPQVTVNIQQIDAAIGDLDPAALRKLQSGLKKAEALKTPEMDIEDAEIVSLTLDSGGDSN